MCECDNCRRNLLGVCQAKTVKFTRWGTCKQRKVRR